MRGLKQEQGADYRKAVDPLDSRVAAVVGVQDVLLAYGQELGKR